MFSPSAWKKYYDYYHYYREEEAWTRAVSSKHFVVAVVCCRILKWTHLNCIFYNQFSQQGNLWILFTVSSICNRILSSVIRWFLLKFRLNIYVHRLVPSTFSNQIGSPSYWTYWFWKCPKCESMGKMNPTFNCELNFFRVASPLEWNDLTDDIMSLSVVRISQLGLHAYQ